MNIDLNHALRQGLGELGLVLRDAQTAHLLDYLALIQKWTKVYNLTAVRDAQEMLSHHLLDSLAVIGPLTAQLRSAADADLPADVATRSYRLLDVGSGAGLPGVVIAICCPNIQVHCVDTVAKKAAFIQQVAAAVRLPNLRGLHKRVEQIAEPYDIISARAFASLSDFTSWSAAALAPQGIWMAMKGKNPGDELAALPPTVKVFHVEQLKVPQLDAERCLVWMRRGQT